MKSKIFIPIALALLFTASCDDFLEEQTFSQLTPDIVYTSYENAQLAINGLYIAHFELRQGQQMWWCAQWGQICQEFSAFNTNNNYDLKFQSTFTQVYWFWRSLYIAINASNSAIDGITNMSDDLITAAQKTALIAEARFMRAHGYYLLMKLWGGVPLLDEPTLNPDAAFKPRTQVQDVFDFIEADLKFAQTNLPVSYTGSFPDNGRCTKGAATAMLAEMYCYASGEQFKGNDAVAGNANFNNLGTYWTQARAELVSLIDAANPAQAADPYMYSLEPDLALLYTSGEQVAGQWVNTRNANNLGQEIIWTTHYAPELLDGTWNFNHWNGRYISPYQLSRFEQGGYRAEIKQDSVTRANLGRIVTRHIKRNRVANDNDNQFYFTRYGGMLLLLAYVENEINNGPTALAEACLNAVRARARAGDGVTTYTVPADVTPGLSYAQFKDEVYDEAVVELFHEEKFWWWAHMTGKMQSDWGDIASGQDGDRGPYDKRWKLYPIPERDIIASGGQLEQNPGH